MKLSLDLTNPNYFDLVRERTEQRTALECFKQTHRILQEHSPVANCIDIGCASAYLYFHIADLIDEYHGLDPSAKFIEYGKKEFKRLGIRNVIHHCGWFEEFNPSIKFDALLCLGLFYIFPNYHWYIDKMVKMTNKVIIIRALFSEDTKYRYVPDKQGSNTWTYYNIYSIDAVTEFIESRNWRAEWHDDEYVQKTGGYYETAGMEFPFKFLVLIPKD